MIEENTEALETGQIESGPASTDKPVGTVASSSSIDKQIDPSCYRYDGTKCFYVDPATGAEYEWNEESKEWDHPKTYHSKPPNNFSSKDYTFDGETFYFKDEKSKTSYKWDKDKNEWISQSGIGSGAGKKLQEKEYFSDVEEFDEGESKPEFKRQDMTQGIYGYDGDAHTYTDSKDGTVYIWEKEKNAWFPKVDEDFLVQYQMNYGFNSPEPEVVKDPEPKKEVIEADRTAFSLKRKQDPTWFDMDEKSNNKVYVSNLPLDLTEKEFIDLMQKCGLVMKEMDSTKFKIKMYTDPETKAFKGDALCTYIKVESVNLALNILDGYDYKGKKICVERAKFQMKGDSYNPSLKPKKKSKKQMEKLKKVQQKLFDWRPDKLRGERDKNERVVIIKNLFEPSLFDNNVSLILEYQQDIREEASKCGDIKKVVIYDRHPDGVAQVTFKEADAADACIQLLNNRWFGKRQIKAETWDGKTKYTVAETAEQKAERLKKWEKHLEKEEAAEKEQSISAKSKSQVSGEDTQSSGESDVETDEETSTSQDKNTLTHDKNETTKN